MPEPRVGDLGGALDLAPAEAVEWFRRKGFEISDGWRDVRAAQHAHVFTVARMSRYDLLADTRRIIDRGLAEGMATDRIAAGLEERLRGAGWWGIETRADGTEVMLGSPHRVRTIVRTNIQTAYSAGRYRRQREVMGARPYWQYSAVLDAVTRPSHRELHGKVFRADDPIWQTIYPPNGFKCRCRVRALSERQVRARGLDVLEGDSGLGGFTPDEGWDYAPGAHGPLRDPDAGAKAVPGQPMWRDYGRPDARKLDAAPAPPMLPAAASPGEARRMVEGALGLTDDVSRRVIKTPADEVLLDRAKVSYIAGKGGEHRERFANRILPTLQEPSEVWMTYYDSGEFRKRYLKVFEGEGGGLSVVTETPGGAVLYNFVPKSPGKLNRDREGVLLYPGGSE